MKASRRTWSCLLLVTWGLLLAGCGFHLRGTTGASLPESLMRLRVAVQNSRLVHEPLLVTMTDALRNDAGVTVTDAADAPLLELSGERVNSQVQAVSVAGRARGYTLRYEVSFRVANPNGTEMLAEQTVRLLRDYSFDPVNVLAKEREEDELRQSMRLDAVQQILRRLASGAAKKDEKAK